MINVFQFFLFFSFFSLPAVVSGTEMPPALVADSARVYVSFVLKADGTVSNVKAVKIECPGCSNKEKRNFKEESIRVVKSIPPVSPREEPVKYLLPIKFVLK